MSFYKLKAALEQEGWYVGWAEGYFQDEGWFNVPSVFPKDHPHAGQEVDLDKCIFNIIQDVEKEDDYILELGEKLDKGIITDDEYEELVQKFYEEDDWDEQFYTPDEVFDSCFCFGEVDTLKEILPIIEASGCRYHWDGSIKQRIEISWGRE